MIFKTWKLVHCTSRYWEDVLDLRNETRQSFGDTDKIDSQTHKTFMLRHFVTYRACLHGDKFIGFIGHVNGDIRLAVVPEYQGRGVGKWMLKLFMKQYPDAYAKVKVSNIPSQKLFLSAGFDEEGFASDEDEDLMPEWITYRYAETSTSNR